MNEPFGLVVRFTLNEGAADAFDRLVADTVRSINSDEPGTLVYAVHRVADRPELRVFYELYRDREAFDVHESQPHTRHFLDQRDHYLVSTEVHFLSLQEAKGLPSQPPA